MTTQAYNVYPSLTPARVATTANVSGTYYNGTLNNGLNATFTTAVGVLTIDDIVVVENDRVLLKNQTSALENGLYICTQTGSATQAAILERSADQQSTHQMFAGFCVSIAAGTANAGSVCVLEEPVPNYLGVDSISWRNTSASGGSVTLPTIANTVAIFTNTSGNISSITTSANSAEILIASLAQDTVFNILDPGTDANFILSQSAAPTQTISTGNIIIAAGQLTVGNTGGPFQIRLMPTSASSGYLAFQGNNNTGNTVTTIANDAMGQACTISIPDPAATTADFLLDTGTGQMTSGSTLKMAKGTGTTVILSVTINEQCGVITTEALATAAQGSSTVLLNNNKIAANSVVMVSVMGGTNTNNNIAIRADAGIGASSIIISNTTVAAGAALNGTLILGFAIF